MTTIAAVTAPSASQCLEPGVQIAASKITTSRRVTCTHRESGLRQTRETRRLTASTAETAKPEMIPSASIIRP